MITRGQTVEITNPGTPGQKSLTNYINNPNGKHVKPGSQIFRTNYAVDPQGKTGGKIIGIGQSPASAAISTAYGRGSATSYRVIFNLSTTSGFGFVTDQLTNLQEGEVITWSFWVFSPSKSFAVTSYWEGQRADSTYAGGPGTQVSFSSVIPAGAWTKVSGQMTVAAPNIGGRIDRAGAYQFLSAQNDTIYVTDAIVERTNVGGDFFSGATTNDLGWSYQWTGTANNSVSTAIAASTLITENLILNPRAEGGTGTTALWTNLYQNPSFETVQTGTTTMRENLHPNPRVQGSTSWALTASGTTATFSSTGGPNTYGTSGYIQAVCDGTANQQGISAAISSNLVNNAPYRGRIKARVTSGTANALIYSRVGFSGGSTTLIDSSAQVVTLTTSWQEFSYATNQNPVGTTIGSVSLYVRMQSQAAVTIQASEALIEQTSTDRPYFDGSMTDALGWDYGWSGTANASTSTAKAAYEVLGRNLITNPKNITTAGAQNLYTNLVTNPRGKAPNTTAVVRRTNMATNPHAINSGAAYQSSTPSASTLTYNATGASDGGSAYQIVTTTGDGSLRAAFPLLTNQLFAVGDKVIVSFDINAPVATAGTVELGFSTASGGSPTLYPNSQVLNLAVGANRVTGTVTVAAAAYLQLVQFRTQANVSAGQTWRVSRVTIEKNTSGDYFDGTTTSKTSTFAWTGTANASTSTMTSAYVEARRNLMSVSNSEAGLNSFLSAGGGSTTRTNVVDAAVPGGGTQVTQFVWVSGASGPQTILATDLIPGATYTLSLWFKQVSGTLSTPWVTVDGLYGNPVNMTVTGTAGAWQRASVTRTLPAGMNTMMAYSLMGAAGTIRVDNVLLEQSAILGDYFDGSSTDTTPYVYEWTGATNASPSVQRSRLPVSIVAESNAIVTQETVDGQPAVGHVMTSAVVPSMYTTYAVTNGTTYTFSWDARLEAPVSGIVDRAYIGPGVAQSVTDITSTGWTRVSFTFVANAATVQVYWNAIVRASGNAALNTKMYRRNFMLVQGTYVDEFFDGATTRTNSWTGAANNSLSRQIDTSTGAVLRSNFLANPGFEINVNGYSTYGNANTASWQPGGMAGSAGCMKLTPTGASSQGVVANVSGVPGAVHTFSVWTNRISGAAGAYIQVNNAANNTVLGALTPVPTTAGWQRTSVTFTMPAGDAFFNIIVFYSGAVAGTDSLLADNFMVEQSAIAGTYFDGSTVEPYTYAWTGTADASISVENAVDVSGSSVASADARAYQTPGISSSGKSFAVETLGRTGSNNTFAAIGGDVSAMRLGMVAGGVYTASATVTTLVAQINPNASRARNVELWYKNSAGSYVNTMSTSAPVVGTARVSVTMSIPAGATEAFLRLNNGSPTQGDIVYFEDILLAQESSRTNYFDGNTPHTDVDYAWTGAVNNSTSEIRGPMVNSVSVPGGGLAASIYGGVYQSNEWSASGSASMKIVPNSGNADTFVSMPVNFTTWVPGRTYTMTARKRLLSAHTSFLGSAFDRGFRVIGSTSSGSFTANATGTNVPGEETISMTFTLPADFTGMSFIRLCSGARYDANAENAIWFDQFQVFEGAYTGTYFDGDTSGSGDFTYAWVGTAHNSQSRMLAPALDAGTFLNSGVAGANLEYGNKAYKKTVTNLATFKNSMAYLVPVVPIGQTASYRVVTPYAAAARYTVGKTYSVSFYAKASVVTPVSTLMIANPSAVDKPVVSLTPVTTFANFTTAWQRFVYTFVATANTSTATSGIYIALTTNPTVESTFEMTGMVIAEGPDQGFFDGTTPNKDYEVTNWSGTVNASYSRMITPDLVGWTDGSYITYRPTGNSMLLTKMGTLESSTICVINLNYRPDSLAFRGHIQFEARSVTGATSIKFGIRDVNSNTYATTLTTETITSSWRTITMNDNVTAVNTTNPYRFEYRMGGAVGDVVEVRNLIVLWSPTGDTYYDAQPFVDGNTAGFVWQGDAENSPSYRPSTQLDTKVNVVSSIPVNRLIVEA